MSPVKLHYFNLRGRAEYIRWILEFCGVEYEDIRYTFEEWPQIKQSKTEVSFIISTNDILESVGKTEKT